MMTKEATMRHENPRLIRVIADAEGASFVELALVLPLFLMMLIPVVDLGRGFYAAIEVASAAHAGAMYGVENPSDTSGMVQAAKAGTSNLADVDAAATYGCECSDGSSPIALCTSTPSCTYNYVTYVDVTVTSPYRTVFGYPGLPSSMNITREVRLRVGGD
jgi:Flp pilus assembly protein TadG